MICAAPGLSQRIEHLPYSAAARLASLNQTVPQHRSVVRVDGNEAA